MGVCVGNTARSEGEVNTGRSSGLCPAPLHLHPRAFTASPPTSWRQAAPSAPGSSFFCASESTRVFSHCSSGSQGGELEALWHVAVPTPQEILEISQFIESSAVSYGCIALHHVALVSHPGACPAPLLTQATMLFRCFAVTHGLLICE